MYILNDSLIQLSENYVITAIKSKNKENWF